MPQFVEAARDAIKALGGVSPEKLSKAQRAEAMRVWFKMFKTYGTHFITELTVGGKVIYSRYVSQNFG